MEDWLERRLKVVLADSRLIFLKEDDLLSLAEDQIAMGVTFI